MPIVGIRGHTPKPFALADTVPRRQPVVPVSLMPPLGTNANGMQTLCMNMHTPNTPPDRESEVVQNQPMQTRQQQLDFVQHALRKLGLKPSQLANRAGVEPSTVTGFLAGRSNLLREATLEKLAHASGIELPEPSGFAEPETMPFEGRIDAPDISCVGNIFALVLNTSLMELEGLEAGDYLFFDRGAAAKPGQIVCAQLYDLHTGTAETVVRLYQGGFLVARSRERWEPRLVDDERTKIIAPLIRQVRDRDWT
jgi:transcriptional regulator with XRE-family HTH domain